MERIGPSAVLIPQGELDIASAHRLVTAALGIVREPGPVVLDLGALTFIDVAGVRAVLHVAELLGERLELRAAPPAVQRVFVLTGAERELRFASSGSVSAFPAAGERNLRFAKRIWQAFAQDGLEAALLLIPPAAEWRLLAAPGCVVRGAEEFRTLYAGRSPRAVAVDFRSVGDDVLVHFLLQDGEGAERPLYSLLEFERGMLVRATTFEHEREALAGATAG